MMKPSVRRILDDMFTDAYTAQNEGEAIAAVAVALVRLGAENAVDVAEIVAVLRQQYMTLAQRIDASEREAG